MKAIELKPIAENPSDYDEIMERILLAFRKEIYRPLLKEIDAKQNVLKNSLEDLINALRSGKVTYYRGYFRGRFSSTLSRELRRLGAEWDRRQGAFAIPQSKLPVDIKTEISVSLDRFERTAQKVMDRLADVPGFEVDLEDLFDKAIWKTERRFKDTLKNITVSPTLTPEAAKRIAREYSENIQIYIQDWTQKETLELRKRIQERAVAGYRYDDLVAEIQKSYGQSYNKAKFLARQETSLLMTKFKQVRYEEAGVREYRWHCVSGTALHPVRPYHKVLNGKVFRWDDPPVVDDKGNRKNPGQDYNCRCTAIPIVKF